MSTSPTQDRSLPKRYAWLSLVVMVLLLVMAGIFWKERAWFLDVAYQTVLMIKDGTVQVQVYRFGAAVVQALPLVAIKLELPLTWVSFFYSISFNLIYLVFLLLILGWLRQYAMGMALALLYTLMTVDGFYWCTSELQQGLGFLLVVWAFVLRYPTLDRWWHWSLLLPASVALVFYHPLVFIPFFFCWVYFGWTNQQLRHGRYALLLLVLFVLVWAKGHWFGNWYDAAKMETFRANFDQHFPQLFSFPAYGKFLHNALYYWWGFPLGLLVLSFWYGRQRRWIPLLLVWGASIGFLVLNAIGSPDPSYRFYSEVNYYPLAIFVGVPLCYEILPALSNRRWAWWGMIVFFAARLLLITWHHQPYTERLVWMAGKLDAIESNNTGDRFLLPQAAAPMDTLIMSWGTPFESLLMSAAEAPEHTLSLFITPDPARFPDSIRQRSDLFLMEFFNIQLDELQGPYFQFEPAGSYQLLEN